MLLAIVIIGLIVLLTLAVLIGIAAGNDDAGGEPRRHDARVSDDEPR